MNPLNDRKSYRPISLLPIITKLIEKLLQKRPKSVKKIEILFLISNWAFTKALRHRPITKYYGYNRKPLENIKKYSDVNF